jgi:hypothetical protein
VGGGLLGAFFIRINNQVNILRKKILKTKLLKILESVVLVILTVTTMYMCVAIKHKIYYTGDPKEDLGTVCQYYTFKPSDNPDSPTVMNDTKLTFRQYLCELPEKVYPADD